MMVFQKLRIWIRHLRYPGSAAYWEKRYVAGGDSGAGSSGLLAQYKAATVNQFVATHGITSVVEFGCGDGQQLQLAQYPAYLGLDIAPSSIHRCRELFALDPHKQFALYTPETFQPLEVQRDMALSLEVIFHLTEDRLYQLYMAHLFASARKWVVVFSSNGDDDTGGRFPHVRIRRFLADVPPGWVLHTQLPNPHSDRSMSEFYFFQKQE
jgi:SAM-dependent methyltransferase